MIDVNVRWHDGYLETFECSEVRFGSDLLWMRLSDGNDLIIKVTGGSEINTLARCFEFAAAELQLERIVNTLRYINSERKHINSKSLIPRPDMIETEFVNKIKYMYNNALHNLMYIEYKEEQNNVTY